MRKSKGTVKYLFASSNKTHHIIKLVAMANNNYTKTEMEKKQAFITKSNLNSIISNLEEIGQKNTTDYYNLYKWPIYFLSKIETDRLIREREFLKNPENIFKVYKKRIKTDKKKYIFEGLTPSYHTRTDCKNLQSKYKNFELPVEIQEKSDEEIERFRKWFKDNQHYLNDKPDLFVAKMQIAFGLETTPIAVQHDNSGMKELDNLNLNELEVRVDVIIRAAGSFYNDNPDKQTIIKRFSKYTFLAYKKDPINNNDTKLSDEELKSFLFEYDHKFKKPFKELLLQYLMVKYNPDLKFDGLLLDQLGFKMCHNCYELDSNERELQRR